jgi:hypothetical protein
VLVSVHLIDSAVGHDYFDGEQTHISVTASTTPPRRTSSNGFDRLRAEPNGPGLRFQPDALASWLYFASVSCTSADHMAAAAPSLREHAIQARDFYQPPDRPRPYSAAAGLSITEDLCPPIASLPLAARDGGLQ